MTFSNIKSAWLIKSMLELYKITKKQQNNTNKATPYTT